MCDCLGPQCFGSEESKVNETTHPATAAHQISFIFEITGRSRLFPERDTPIRTAQSVSSLTLLRARCDCSSGFASVTVQDVCYNATEDVQDLTLADTHANKRVHKSVCVCRGVHVCVCVWVGVDT